MYNDKFGQAAKCSFSVIKTLKSISINSEVLLVSPLQPEIITALNSKLNVKTIIFVSFFFYLIGECLINFFESTLTHT